VSSKDVVCALTMGGEGSVGGFCREEVAVAAPGMTADEGVLFGFFHGM